MELIIAVGGGICLALLVYFLVCFILMISCPRDCSSLTLFVGAVTMWVLMFGAMYCVIKFLEKILDIRILMW